MAECLSSWNHHHHGAKQCDSPIAIKPNTDCHGAREASLFLFGALLKQQAIALNLCRACFLSRFQLQNLY
jgi:hypothetical protein